nr:MAG TPA: hypothetical protein [Caudoviricetes sp.]
MQIYGILLNIRGKSEKNREYQRILEKIGGFFRTQMLKMS